MNILKPIDYLLDRLTMYRLVLYYLLVLLAAAVGLSALGYLKFNFLALSFTAGYLTVICWLTNQVFAYVFEAPVNIESVYITALILTLIVNPYKIPHDILFLTAVAGLAISSKFILAIRKKHIFNPAAVAVALMAIGAGQAASWWIGNVYMTPLVVIGGLLVVRKIQRGRMVASYLGAVVASTVVVNLLTRHDVLANLQRTALHSSLFFLAFVMLTEPLTSPTTKRQQTWYAALVGLLFPPQIHLFSLYTTPELTLLVGNVFTYFVSPRVKIIPKLLKKLGTGPTSGDFIFDPGRNFNYKPGQYMEWTLPHDEADSRGNRRYFTLASSPTEENLRLGVKFYDNGSTYKQAMLALDSSSPIAAGHLGGDFVMPEDPSKKLVFIAGGIGVTPFRSMFKYLIDTNDKRQVSLLYSEKNAADFVYKDVLSDAERKLGAKIVYTLTNQQSIPAGWQGRTGYITAEAIVSEVPDYSERYFYISGSPSMVKATKTVLRHLGINRSQIKTDFFPGYV